MLTSLCGLFYIYIFFSPLFLCSFRSFWRSHYLFSLLNPTTSSNNNGKRQQHRRRMCFGFRFIIKNKYCRWSEALAYSTQQHKQQQNQTYEWKAATEKMPRIEATRRKYEKYEKRAREGERKNQEKWLCRKEGWIGWFILYRQIPWMCADCVEL